LTKLFKDQLEVLHPIYLTLVGNLEKIEEVYLPSVCASLTSYAKKFIIKPKMSSIEIQHLDLLFKKCSELIQINLNYAAICSLSSVLFHIISDKKDFQILEKPVLRLLSGPEHYKQLGLNIIHAILEKNNRLFDLYMKYFRITMNDSEYTKLKKIEILSMIANEKNIKWIQKEFEYWIGYFIIKIMDFIIELLKWNLVVNVLK